MKRIKFIRGRLYYFYYDTDEEARVEVVARYVRKYGNDSFIYFNELACTEHIVNTLQGFGPEMNFHKKYFKCKEIPVSDLPLYMHLPYKSKLYDKLLKGGSHG